MCLDNAISLGCLYQKTVFVNAGAQLKNRLFWGKCVFKCNSFSAPGFQEDEEKKQSDDKKENKAK